jgi:hypothetical protein
MQLEQSATLHQFCKPRSDSKTHQSIERHRLVSATIARQAALGALHLQAAAVSTNASQGSLRPRDDGHIRSPMHRSKIFSGWKDAFHRITFSQESILRASQSFLLPRRTWP